MRWYHYGRHLPHFKVKIRSSSSLLLILFSLLLFYWFLVRFWSFEKERPRSSAFWRPSWPSRRTKIPCSYLMKTLTPPYPVLVLDEIFIRKLEKGEVCLKKDFPPYFAHPREHFPKNQDLSSFVVYENRSDYNFYKIVNHTGTARGVHKNQFNLKNNWTLPENATIFREIWRRSSLLKCQNRYMFRNPLQSRHAWSEEGALEAMDELVQYFIQYDMYLFICSGTLLGWYRECNFIPHTHDVDFGVLEEEYLEEAFKDIIENNTRFRPYIRWSDQGETCEYTMYPSQTTNAPKIDIFLYFSNGENSSTYSFGWGEKYRFSYPELYNPNCAIDFRGHLFWAACNPEMALVADYGEKWYRDYHTADYNYVYSTWNMEELGEYNISEGMHYFEEFDTISDVSSHLRLHIIALVLSFL